MLSNFHTHTSICDGKDDAEAVVLSAINKGFTSIGFSEHGYTDFDLSYCMKDMHSYIELIHSLKEKYKKDIQIYTGVEEDAHCILNGYDFDYTIGSSHYCDINGSLFEIDGSFEKFKVLLKQHNGDVLKMSESYYRHFTDYIIKRKPDIVGHFDLLTKYDEKMPMLLNNSEYNEIAERYLTKVVTSGCIFEVNTGAISRGYRTSPYPASNLLYILKKNDAPIILSADSHAADTIDFNFDETRLMLRDIGFKYTMILYNGEFIKESL